LVRAADVAIDPPRSTNCDLRMLGSVVADVAASIIHLRLHRAALEPSWQAGLRLESRPKMRKDVREFIRRLEAVGLTVEPTPGHYRVLRKGEPLRKANGMPFRLPFCPTRSAGAGPRSWSCASSVSTSSTGARNAEAGRLFGHRASTATRSHPARGCQAGSLTWPWSAAILACSVKRLRPGWRSVPRLGTPEHCDGRG
jgi:hypothetical protein